MHKYKKHVCNILPAKFENLKAKVENHGLLAILKDDLHNLTRLKQFLSFGRWQA